MSTSDQPAAALWQTVFDQIEAVFFDFDGLIVETEWAIYQSYLRLYQEENLDLPLELYVKCIGSDHNQWNPEKYLEKLTGKDFPWEQINPARQLEIERDLTNATLLPGVIELIEKLDYHGLAKAVVSSSSHRWVDPWLGNLNILSRFEAIVCREDAAAIKPAPDLYLRAAQSLQIAPEQCLVLEDSENGVSAGKAAGMRVVAVPSMITKVADFSAADFVITSLLELLE